MVKTARILSLRVGLCLGNNVAELRNLTCDMGYA
jgi:hypothetical protein